MNYHRQLLSSEIRQEGSDARWGAWQPTIIPNARLLSGRPKEEEETRVTNRKGERMIVIIILKRVFIREIIRRKTFFADDRVESKVEDPICTSIYKRALFFDIIIPIIIGPDRTTDDEISDESDVINHYPPSASGLISGFVEWLYVECQEDIHDEEL